MFELASAAGLSCDINPALVAAIGNMQTGKATTISATFVNSVISSKILTAFIFECFKPIDNTSIDEEYKLSCLLLVYVAVSLPDLALDPSSSYSREHGGAYLPFTCNSLTVLSIQATLSPTLIMTSSSNYPDC